MPLLCATWMNTAAQNATYKKRFKPCLGYETLNLRFGIDK